MHTHCVCKFILEFIFNTVPIPITLAAALLVGLGSWVKAQDAGEICKPSSHQLYSPYLIQLTLTLAL